MSSILTHVERCFGFQKLGLSPLGFDTVLFLFLKESCPVSLLPWLSSWVSWYVCSFCSSFETCKECQLMLGQNVVLAALHHRGLQSVLWARESELVTLTTIFSVVFVKSWTSACFFFQTRPSPFVITLNMIYIYIYSMSYGILCHFSDILDDTSYGIRWTNIVMDGWISSNGPKCYFLLSSTCDYWADFSEQCIGSPFNHYLTHTNRIKKPQATNQTLTTLSMYVIRSFCYRLINPFRSKRALAHYGRRMSPILAPFSLWNTCEHNPQWAKLREHMFS